MVKMTIAGQKEIGIAVTQGILTVIAILVASLSLPNVFAASWLVIPLAVTAILWVLATALLFGVASNKWIIVISIMLLVVFILLAGGAKIGAVVAALLVAIIVTLARSQIKRDIKDRVHYKASTAFGPGIKLLIIAWLLVLAGLSYPVLQGSIEKQGIQVSQSQVEYIVKPLEPVLTNLLPGISPSVSIDELIDQELSTRFSADELKRIPPAQRQQLRDQVAAQFGEESLTGEETLVGLITGRINEALRTITESNPIVIALLIIVLALLAVRALIPIVAWLLVWLQAGVVKLLMKTGLVRLGIEQTNIERLQL